MSKNKLVRNTYRQFDEFYKFMLTIDTRVLLPILNYLYDTDFKADDVLVILENNEQINLNAPEARFDKGFTDLMIAVTEHYDSKKHRHVFHIELQSRHDKTMPYRMLQYGLQYGYKNAEIADDKMTLSMPRQKVIYPLKLTKRGAIDKLVIKQVNKYDMVFKYESVYVDDIADDDIRKKHLGLFALFKLFNRSLETSNPIKNKMLLESAFETIDENYVNYIELAELEVEKMKQAMQVIIKGDMDLGIFKDIHKEAQRVIDERRRAAAEGKAEGRAEGRAER
ncbi:MAG: hypothetical protein CSB19_00075 [Clostridiales bacterium]|nr:MAG: hypothetical protein CSB19_00075 [Clostridiales bacterium]